MNVIEVHITFRVIEEAQIWTIVCEHGKLDYDWRIMIINEKGDSYNFKHFGPLNNDTIIGLLEENLIYL